MTPTHRSLRDHQRLITILLVLGLIGVYTFTFDDKVWIRLGSNSQSIQTVFLYLFSSFMFLGACLVRYSSASSMLKMSTSLALLMISLLWIFPGIRDNPMVSIILGVALGLLLSTLFFIGIFGLSSEMKIKVVGITLFSIYLGKYLINYVLAATGLNIILPILSAIFLLVFLVHYWVKYEEITDPDSLDKHPFPLRMMVLLGIIIFLSYFETFLVGNGIQFIDISNGGHWEWLNQLVHLAVFLGFYLVGKKPDYSRLLYTSLISTVFAYIFYILPLNASMMTSIFYNISDALGDIILFTLVGEIAFKHGRRPMVFSLLIFSVAAGVIAASYFGSEVYRLLRVNSVLFLGVLLMVFCAYLLILPMLFKYIDKELGKNKNPIRAVGRETAMFNHSLKNMIVQISCGIEVLKKTQQTLNEQIQETLDIMSESVDQMMDIVKYINSKAEEIIIVKELCNMGEIIDSVLDSIRMVEFRSKIDFKKVCDPTIELFCDRKRVRETLYNIVKNACEAIVRGEGEVKVEVLRTRKKIVCHVYDNGKGIPEGQIDKVFKSFYTTKELSNHNYGLGLTYCYIVMEQHQGTIEIQSEVNVGTCVSLIFPG
jgi:signal transduction histidine kinase